MSMMLLINKELNALQPLHWLKTIQCLAATMDYILIDLYLSFSLSFSLIMMVLTLKSTFCAGENKTC